MTADWLVYALVVSALVSVAAWLAERGARAQRWPGRWVWAGALGVSVLAPVVAWLVPGTAPAGGPLGVAPGEYVIETIALGAGAGGSSGPAAEALLLAGWSAASALLLLVVLVLAMRLELRRRGWPRRVVDGVEVLISARTGPAAIGLVRGRVVVPRWALELERSRRRLLILHESEHLRARDPQLAFAGLLLCVLAPWNLPLWWQLRRLRLAIEMDCDARVLRRTRAPRAYGALLLAVGQRKSHLALALAESPSHLERRIRMIAENGKGRALVRGGLLLVLSGVVLALACETPGPVSPGEPTPAPTADPPAADPVDDADAAGSPALADVADAPTFTPMTERPQVTNPDVVRQAAEDRYPRLLRQAGIGGTVAVWFLIDESGEVVKRQLHRGSGHDALDEAALDVARVLEFTPGYNREEPVPVWVSLEITFEPAPAEAEAEAEADVEADRAAREEATDAALAAAREAGPTFTPMTERPEVRNAEEVERALDEQYPSLLRDAGIGGAAALWFFIDETGAVGEVRLARSTGYDALDAAALRVGRVMEFTPARNGDEAVPVWVNLRIVFEQE